MANPTSYTLTDIYEVELRKLGRDERIPAGALHSTNGGGVLRPLAHPAETVGQLVSDFAEDREFFEVLIAMRR